MTEPSSSGKPTVADMTAAYALDAVDHAKAAANVDLDFSEESVGGVEAVLTQLHNALPKSFFAKLFGRGPSSDDILTMSKMYGSYVGEVLRRTRGGEWALIDGQVTLTNGDERVWPIAKVYKRITNGGEDNVAVYFKVLVEEYWTSSKT
jgi:hypothetical protein